MIFYLDLDLYPEVTPANLRDHLEKTKEALRTFGWTRGVYANCKGVCLEGASKVATGNYKFQLALDGGEVEGPHEVPAGEDVYLTRIDTCRRDDIHMINTTYDLLARLVQEKGLRADGMSILNPIAFNDNIADSADDVIALLDEAIVYTYTMEES